MSEATNTSTGEQPGSDGLEDLVHQAGKLDGAATQAQEEQQQQQRAEEREQAEQAFGMVCAVVLQLLPDRYAERYGTREQNGIVQTFGALCEARGWNVSEVVGRWAPELAFAAAIVGPALPVIVADLKQQRKQQEESAKAAARPTPTPAPQPQQQQRSDPRAYPQNMPKDGAP